MKRVVIFEKTNIRTAIMVIAESKGEVLDPVVMLNGKSKCICQAEQNVSKLAIFLANDDLLINYAGRILFFCFFN